MPPAPPPTPPAQLEKLYGITFTKRELDLLTAGADTGLLSPLDSQRRYILLLALQPADCPACGYRICRRSACTAEFDPAGTTPDDAYACPACKARLIWHLALFGGGQSFTLAPDQTVTITRGG